MIAAQRPAASPGGVYRGTGGWGEKGPETENCHSSEQSPNTRRLPAVRPACPGVVCRGAPWNDGAIICHERMPAYLDQYG